MTPGEVLDAALAKHASESEAVHAALGANVDNLRADIVDLEADLVGVDTAIADLKARVAALEGATPPPPPPPPAGATLRISALTLTGTAGRQSTENPGWESQGGYIGGWNTDSRSVVISTTPTTVKVRLRYRATLPARRILTVGANAPETLTLASTGTAWSDPAAWKVVEFGPYTVPAGPTGIVLAADASTWVDLDWIEVQVTSGTLAVIPPPSPPPPDDDVIDPDIGAAGTLVVTSEIRLTDARTPFRLENRTLLCSGGAAGIRNMVEDGRLIGPGKVRWVANRDGRAIANSMGRMIIEGDVIVEGGPWDGCGIQSVGREFGNGEGFLIPNEMIVRPRPDAGIHGIGGLFGYGASAFGMFGFKQENRRTDINKLTVMGARNHVTEVYAYSPDATDGGGIHMGDMSTGSHHLTIDHLIIRDVDGCGAVLFNSPRVTAHIGKIDATGIGLYSGHPALGPGRVMQVSGGVPTGGEGRYVSGRYAISSYIAGAITYGEAINLEGGTQGPVRKV